MTIQITRRDFLRLCGSSSIAAMLAACGVAPTPTTAPTPVSMPTDTPLPASTQPPTATPTLTNTPLPTSTATATATPTLTATPKPPRLSDFARKIGFDIGTTTCYPNTDNANYRDMLLNFTILGEICATATHWTDGPNQKQAFAFLNKLSRFARDNGMRFSVFHLFAPWEDFGKSYHTIDYLLTAPKEDVDAWMRKRVKDLLDIPYVTHANFVNEVLWGNDETGQYGWQNSPNPFYRIYGENWPYEAYKVAYNEAMAIGKKVGDDLRLIWNSSPIETPSPKVEYEFNYVSQLKARLQKETGIDRPFDIGMQFHIRTVPLNQVQCWGPQAKNIEKKALTEHFRRFGQIGDIHITEFSIDGTDDTQQQKQIVHTVVEAALDSGVVKSLMMFDPLGPSRDKISGNITCYMRNVFDASSKPLFLFDELYQIFQTYAQMKKP